MKKTLAIVLALVMILGVIACTPKSATQTPAETKTETKTETTETKPAAASSELAGEYTITVWAAEKVVDLTKKQIEDFNNSNDMGNLLPFLLRLGIPFFLQFLLLTYKCLI